MPFHGTWQNLFMGLVQEIYLTNTLFPLMTYMPFFNPFRACDACTFCRTSCPLMVYTSTRESSVATTSLMPLPEVVFT